jgi:thiol-disulfide isomerase/thioredoxin
VNGIWLVSYLVLWLVVLVQGILIFTLVRELGVRRLRSAEGIANDGLDIGARAPRVAGVDRSGTQRDLAPRGRPLLVIFGSRHCQPCRQLARALDRFASDYADVLDIAFVVRDVAAGVGVTADELSLSVPVLGSDAASDAYKTRVTPFAFLVDPSGTIRAKGLVNDRRGLDGLTRIAGVRRDGAALLATPVPIANRE